MTRYESLNGNGSKQRYALPKASSIDYDRNRLFGNLNRKYEFKPGEFPLIRNLPDIFKNRRPYCSATMIQEEAKIRGYELPESINLPYLGSAEGQTNKTNLS